MASEKPTRLTVRTYDVGFGDCFLLTFHYASRDRHVLIDFGSMAQPKGKIADGKPVKSGYMKRIAQRIAHDCGGRLDVVVATHRHEDHIGGFIRSKGKGPGEIIRSLKPRLVIQPWTEHPQAAVDATGPTRSLHVKTLRQMQVMAAHLVEFAGTLRGDALAAQREELRAIGLDNVKNLDAVQNLQTMGPNHFVHFGKSAKLGAILPGVKVTVLGPPTVDQTDTILTQRREDPDEFWHLNAAFWRRLARTAEQHPAGEAPPLFPRHASRSAPRSAVWFKYRMMREHAESLLSIAHTLDDAMNNSSVILLFEIGGRRILFPGDAQFENWMYALGKPDVLAKLASVDLYKVGHHGSLNATPRTLWKGFDRKGPASKTRRLRTVLSTKEGVHGKIASKTEVPRRSLVNALTRESTLTNTQAFRPDELSREVELDL